MKRFSNYMVKIYDENNNCIIKEYFDTESKAMEFLDKLKVKDGTEATITKVR